MKNEEIREAWRNYLKEEFNPKIRIDPKHVPSLFRFPNCATCSYWFLITEAGLRHIIRTSSPHEYEEIIQGMSGRRLELGPESYRVHRFFGWCKRFPPAPRGGYSITGYRSIFTRLNRRILQNIAEFSFPLMPHEGQCGEWKKDEWVESFIEEMCRFWNVEFETSEPFF